MAKIKIFIGVLLISIPGFGQTTFLRIDECSKKVPDSLTTYAEIADYLAKDLFSDVEKIRAIYIWISHNIKYDLSRINSNDLYNLSEDIVEEVLTTRLGVCQHYSELFLAMCHSIGLKSYLISGYTRKINGEIADLSHAWNAIQLDSNYFLIDVTWAAGYEQNGKFVHKFRDDYFLISPKDFIKTHMPFDPMWQFLDNPLNNNEFVLKDFTKLNSKGDFSYHDSILKYERYNELTQLENANTRILSCGINNILIKRQVDENLLQIANIKYNLAIDTLNYGIDYYNLYATYKNRRFRNPRLSDARIKELIDNAGHGIYSADKMFYGLYSSNKELYEMIVDARNRMSGLISVLEKEEDFVDRYLKKWKPLRIFMFH